MPISLKFGLATAGLCSLVALTGCQSQPQKPNRGGDGARYDMPRGEQSRHYQGRAGEHGMMKKQLKHACEGKAVGSTVQVQRRAQTISGQCELAFRADRDSLKQWKNTQRSTATQVAPMNRDQVMTDAQRATLTQQFDQRLAQQQLYQRAVHAACQNQTAGKAVKLQVGSQSINGTCQVQFKPNLAKAQPSV